MVITEPKCHCPCHTGMASHVAACQCERDDEDEATIKEGYWHI